MEINIDDINYAKGLGIISGSNGNFYPEQGITGTDAAVMLIRSRGYAAVEDQIKGVYPAGYTKLAGELKLFSGAEVTDMNKPLSYEQIAVIFINALNTKIMYWKTNGNYTKAKDATALNYYHNIFQAKDIVNANNKTNLIGTEILSDWRFWAE